MTVGLKSYLFLTVGGALGVLCRYQIGLWISSHNASSFPWATLLINVTGSFLLGFLIRLLTDSSASPAVRLLFTTGFCGGYTTLSTFSYEFVMLLESQQAGLAVGYMAGTMALSPLACVGGIALASALA